MRQIILALGIIALAAPVWADVAATKAVNDLRASKGRAPLVYSRMLEAAAQAHADDMARAGFFAHEGSNGSSVGDRVKRAGYTWCFVAENIAKGQKSLDLVMQSWTTSKGHYANMTHRNAREFALARAAGNLWVMVLAKPC